MDNTNNTSTIVETATSTVTVAPAEVVETPEVVVPAPSSTLAVKAKTSGNKSKKSAKTSQKGNKSKDKGVLAKTPALVKTAQKEKTESVRSVGRPCKTPRMPKKLRFTFQDLVQENEGHCSVPHLRNWIHDDMKTEAGNLKNNSTLMILKGETVDPIAKDEENKGLGRRRMLYVLRVNAGKVNPKKNASVTMENSSPVTQPEAEEVVVTV